MLPLPPESLHRAFLRQSLVLKVQCPQVAHFQQAATFAPVPGSQHGSAERGAHSSNHASGAGALSEPAAAPERASLDGSVSAFANTDNALGFSGRLRSGNDATPATPRGEHVGSSGQGPTHDPSPFGARLGKKVALYHAAVHCRVATAIMVSGHLPAVTAMLRTQL